jgi:predicted DNA-binding transcriptional regulator AlpA
MTKAKMLQKKKNVSIQKKQDSSLENVVLISLDEVAKKINGSRELVLDMLFEGAFPLPVECEPPHYRWNRDEISMFQAVREWRRCDLDPRFKAALNELNAAPSGSKEQGRLREEVERLWLDWPTVI